MTDREAGAIKYDDIGSTYTTYRCPDPRIATTIERALAGARSVVDVGAGTGSYEPRTAHVVAVEPSRLMIGQRPAPAAPVVQAVAEHLPFVSKAFDAGLAVLTVHHWTDPAAGLRDLARVSRRQRDSRAFPDTSPVLKTSRSPRNSPKCHFPPGE